MNLVKLGCCSIFLLLAQNAVADIAKLPFDLKWEMSREEIESKGLILYNYIHNPSLNYMIVGIDNPPTERRFLKANLFGDDFKSYELLIHGKNKLISMDLIRHFENEKDECPKELVKLTKKYKDYLTEQYGKPDDDGEISECSYSARFGSEEGDQIYFGQYSWVRGTYLKMTFRTEKMRYGYDY